MTGGFARLLVVLAAITMVGCAELPRPRPTLLEQVNGWVEQEQYGKAIDALREIPAGHPHRDLLEARRLEVDALARDYEDRQIQQARFLAEQGDPASALAALENALQKLPDSRRLLDEHNTLRRRQMEQQMDLERQALIIHAESLLKRLPLLEERARLDRDDLTAQWEVEQARKELDRMREQLTAYGVLALDADRIDAAEQYLGLARRIGDTPELQEAWTRLGQIKAERRRAKRPPVPSTAERDTARRQALQATEEKRAEARAAIAEGDLLTSRRLLDELLANGQDDEATRELSRAVDEAIAAKADELLRAGNALYLNGEIERAKQTWEAGLALDPDHEQLRASVQRAERVLDRIRELQNRGVRQAPGETLGERPVDFPASTGEAPSAPDSADEQTPTARGTRPPAAAMKSPQAPSYTGQPRREEWLLSQDPSYYTWQLTAARDETTVLRFVDTYGLSGTLAYFRSLHQGKDWYALLYGIYPDPESARTALTGLPRPVRDESPWLRTLRSVQADIQRLAPSN